MFDQPHLGYDRWSDENREVFKAEVRALRALPPTRAAALGVGAGTGRFAVAHSIAYTVEPSRNMALVAKSRGIHACQALGESLPYPRVAFDTVSLTPLFGFVEDSRAGIHECGRVLRPGAHLLIGMIDKHDPLGALHESLKAAERVLPRRVVVFRGRQDQPGREYESSDPALRADPDRNAVRDAWTG